jgi:hypothetical protein
MSSRKKLAPGPHRVTDLFDMKKYPEMGIIWGIFVDEGCVTGDDPLEWREVDAHAHSLKDDEWNGWICIADPRLVVTPTGRPTHTMIHEVAHLILQNTSHGKKWSDTVVRLGGAKEAKKFYKPREKKELVDVKNEESHDGDDGRVEPRATGFIPDSRADHPCIPTVPAVQLYQVPQAQ